MALATNNTAVAGGLIATLQTQAHELAAKYRAHREYRKTIDELRALTDRELADLGLHRSMIKRVAKEAVYDR
ncbi:DUF1127 domain-containing protein [Shimia biformata]|uniref:DUF1127 domain-containing protein n=1 Tax=Shimia biformata TaxID=1294299 RepID=UPI0019524867|nr:DUF1127 domain-containing protein [Shimia biformata]